MIDNINNPQAKLQQQAGQANTSTNAKAQYPSIGNIPTEVPNANMEQVAPEGSTAADINSSNQEQKRGFKSLLAKAKEGVLDRGKQYLKDKVTGGIDNSEQPQLDNKQPEGKQLKETPKAENPTPSIPEVNRPESNRRPKPQIPSFGPKKLPSPPKMKMPKFK
jgi:hypothetical protein